MANKSTKVGYHLVRNATSTARMDEFLRLRVGGLLEQEAERNVMMRVARAFATLRTKACVAAMPKAEIVDGGITAMRGVSTPPNPRDAKMRWNALCPLDGDKFLLVSDIEGRIVLRTGTCTGSDYCVE